VPRNADPEQGPIAGYYDGTLTDSLVQLKRSDGAGKVIGMGEQN
jgi:hypothetical protein